VKKLFLALAGCLALYMPRASAQIVPQGQELHGGDIAVSLFLGIAYKTLYCFSKNQEMMPAVYFHKEFETALNKVKVYSVEKTFINGNEVDAINNRDAENPQIRISRTRWLREDLSDVMRARLVVHEMMGIMGYQDSNYEISYSLVEKNKNCIGGQP
jgi:hypothetical protein